MDVILRLKEIFCSNTDEALKYRNYVYIAILILLYFIYAIFTYNAHLVSGITFVNEDNYAQYNIPLLLQQHDILYKNIYSLDLPLAYYINAFIMKIFDNKIGVLYVLSAINSFVILSCVFFITKKITNLNIAFLSALCSMLIFIFRIGNWTIGMADWFLPYSFPFVYSFSTALLACLFLVYYLQEDTHTLKNIYLSFLCLGISLSFSFDFWLLIFVLIYFCLKYGNIKNLCNAMLLFLLPIFISFILFMSVGGHIVQDSHIIGIFGSLLFFALALYMYTNVKSSKSLLISFSLFILPIEFAGLLYLCLGGYIENKSTIASLLLFVFGILYYCFKIKKPKEWFKVVFLYILPIELIYYTYLCLSSKIMPYTENSNFINISNISLLFLSIIYVCAFLYIKLKNPRTRLIKLLLYAIPIELFVLFLLGIKENIYINHINLVQIINNIFMYIVIIGLSAYSYFKLKSPKLLFIILLSAEISFFIFLCWGGYGVPLPKSDDVIDMNLLNMPQNFSIQLIKDIGLSFILFGIMSAVMLVISYLIIFIKEKIKNPYLLCFFIVFIFREPLFHFMDLVIVSYGNLSKDFLCIPYILVLSRIFILMYHKFKNIPL